MLQKHTLIRAIYLYLFTILGLALITIATVRMIDMGLKAFVFKKVDAPENFYNQYSCLQMGFPITPEKLEAMRNNDEISEEQSEIVTDFLEDYKSCKERSPQISYVVSQRQRDASINLSMLFVGLPLYIYHWLIIKKETNEGKLSNKA